MVARVSAYLVRLAGLCGGRCVDRWRAVGLVRCGRRGRRSTLEVMSVVVGIVDVIVIVGEIVAWQPQTTREEFRIVRRTWLVFRLGAIQRFVHI